MAPDRPGAVGKILDIVVSRQGDIEMVRLRGRFGFAAHREFRKTVDAVMEDSTSREIRFDLGEATELDCAALGMLLLSLERAREAGKTVSLANARGACRSLLDMANFGKRFAVV